jgi:hypothetical protein
MADLAVIVPSRGRPRQLGELLDAIYATAETDVDVYAAVDLDDPTRTEYTGEAVFVAGERRSLSAWTNYLAERVLAGTMVEPPRYLASLGDDHRPRTKGWDRKLIAAIESLGGAPGIAYGNDLLQGARLPTAWVVSADLVRAVGWMMLPSCQHMYVDNAVLALGQAAGRILYCPDVVIEHLHPAAGKATLDDSYRESGAPERYAADEAAYTEWVRTGLAADAAKVLLVSGCVSVDTEA